MELVSLIRIDQERAVKKSSVFASSELKNGWNNDRFPVLQSFKRLPADGLHRVKSGILSIQFKVEEIGNRSRYAVPSCCHIFLLSQLIVETVTADFKPTAAIFYKPFQVIHHGGKVFTRQRETEFVSGVDDRHCFRRVQRRF